MSQFYCICIFSRYIGLVRDNDKVMYISLTFKAYLKIDIKNTEKISSFIELHNIYYSIWCGGIEEFKVHQIISIFIQYKTRNGSFCDTNSLELQLGMKSYSVVKL